MFEKKMTREEFQEWLKGKSEKELLAEVRRLLAALEKNQNVINHQKEGMDNDNDGRRCPRRHCAGE